MNNVVDIINSFSYGGKLSILWFLIVLVLLFSSSMKLVNYSNIISEKTKLNGAFVGGVLLATITSTPELVTEIVQAISGEPSKGFADDIGSNFFSIFMIGIVSIVLYKKHKLLCDSSRWVRYSIYNSTLISFIAFLGAFINNDITINLGFTKIGIFPMILFFAFLTFLFAQSKIGDSDEPALKMPEMSIKKAWGLFTINAILVIFLSIILNLVVNSMQDGYSISHASAGGIFLSITTSLPEVVVFVLLVLKGKYIVALSAITGSHAFNLAITFIGDLVFTSGPSFSTPEMYEIMPIALMAFLSISLLSIHLYFHDKYGKITKYYLIVPIIVSLIYIVGWITIISI